MRSALRFFFRFWLVNTAIAAGLIAVNLHAYQWSGQLTANLYVPLAILGQAFALSTLVCLLAAPLLLLPKPLRIATFGLLAGTGQFMLLLNSQVFSVYRFHIDAFFIKMFFTEFTGLGVGWRTVALGVLALVICLGAAIVLALWCHNAKAKLPSKRALTVMLVATLSGQALHAWGYAHNMRNIVSLTHVIPWYVPLTATTDMERWGLINPEWVEDSSKIDISLTSSMNYPLAPLECTATNEQPNIIFITLESWRFDQFKPDITPNLYSIGQSSLAFNNHLSGGAGTSPGLFSLFFGAPYLYWDGAFSLRPALFQATNLLGYNHHIIVNQNMVDNKRQQAFFKGIDPIQNMPESPLYQGDINTLTKLNQAIDASPNEPFFSYIMLGSSHFPYYTPPNYDKPFLPAEMLAITNAKADTDPLPHLNQYANSAHFLDGIVGQLKSSLEQRGLWDNTIVVVTGDHGEEFNDQGQNYWGHGSNFSRYQVGVPLVIHWPGKQGQVNYRTSHEDIAATIITEAMGCNNDFAELSTGYSLFDDQPRTVIASSYVNKAIIMDDTVNELYPGFVKTYNLNNINNPASSPAGILTEVQRIQSHFR